MELFDTRYYKMSKMLLSFLGQWPGQTPWTRRFLRTLLALTMTTIALPELIKLIDVLDDFEIVFECIPSLGLHALSIMKCTTCANHMDDMMKLLQHMQRDWRSREGEDGSPTLRKYAERGRIIAVGYAYYMFVGATTYVCIPLLPLVLDVVQPLNASRPRELFFRTEYFVDQENYFFPIFFHSLITTNISMGIVVAFDTMYSAYVHYACAIFDELGDKVEKPVENKNESLYVSKEDDHVYRHITECIKKHKKAIEFVDLIETMYTMYFLLAIGMNIFLISTTGVQIVMKGNVPKLVLRYSIFGFGQVIHSFFGCWHGQLLIDHSEKINVCLYKSYWYTSSFRSRRLLRIMMMKTAEPCQLSGGKIFFISMDTFTTIIKTASSYFTVLRSLQ